MPFVIRSKQIANLCVLAIIFVLVSCGSNEALQKGEEGGLSRFSDDSQAIYCGSYEPSVVESANGIQSGLTLRNCTDKNVYQLSCSSRVSPGICICLFNGEIESIIDHFDLNLSLEQASYNTERAQLLRDSCGWPIRSQCELIPEECG